MIILYNNNKVNKLCNKARGKLKRRLDDIDAASTMDELMTLPGKCHALKHNRKGQWALHLEHPKRLVFVPEASPLPLTKDGRLNLSEITAIRILEVIDYHGK